MPQSIHLLNYQTLTTNEVRKKIVDFEVIQFGTKRYYFWSESREKPTKVSDLLELEVEQEASFE